MSKLEETGKSAAFRMMSNAIAEAETTAIHAVLTAILLRRDIPLEDAANRVVRHAVKGSENKCSFYLDGSEDDKGEKLVSVVRYLDNQRVCFDISCLNEDDAKVIKLASDVLEGITEVSDE